MLKIKKFKKETSVFLENEKNMLKEMHDENMLLNGIRGHFKENQSERKKK